MACLEAIKAVSFVNHGVQSAEIDLKGHVVATDATGEVAYCGACYITRKTRDYKYIAVKPLHRCDCSVGRGLWDLGQTLVSC